MKAKILGLLATGMMLGPMAANAVMVNTGSNGTWEITTTTGYFPDLSAQLQAQEFWGNQPLARILSDALGSNLGFPNFADIYAPFFAWGSTQDSFSAETVSSFFGGIDPRSIEAANNITWTFALATRRTTVPEPGTLALLGLGLAGLGVSRRRKAA